MSASTIRAGLAADSDAVLALWEGAGGRPSRTDDAASIGALLARDPDALLVAETDGEVVGSLIAAWDGWRGSFYKLAVNPRRQRQGLATALVRAGEERLWALGAARLIAIVAEEHEAAVLFWIAAGYEQQASTGRFVRNR